ncbi:DUF4382 domain-containing protein [Vulgatibacter sp.]|uniref:DUF4382 domain-containing protein n=1 Tax=Vulgatibacter sp. TaxID=1971226 RepID=UPI0035676E9E
MSKNALFLASTLLLAACGGGGTLSLRLTDAPPDTENMESVFVTIGRVEAHVVDHDEKTHDDDAMDHAADGDKKWQTIALPEGAAERTFDLLALQNGVSAFLGEDGVDGKVTQIRLWIDEAGRNEVLMKDGATCVMQVKDADKPVKINHPFKAIAVDGDEREVTIDMDVKESVTMEGTCAYTFKPVIKIKKVK